VKNLPAEGGTNVCIDGLAWKQTQYTGQNISAGWQAAKIKYVHDRSFMKIKYFKQLSLVW
jgi:hypothetical protein